MKTRQPVPHAKNKIFPFARHLYAVAEITFTLFLYFVNYGGSATSVSILLLIIHFKNIVLHRGNCLVTILNNLFSFCYSHFVDIALSQTLEYHPRQHSKTFCKLDLKMDPKISWALKKKRELLGGINKRKMSLRKHMDSFKQNECRLDITQITKCVFLGSLCLKPVPQLFDSPLLLEELDMKVGNVRSDIEVNNENKEKSQTSNGDKPQASKESYKKATGKKCLKPPKIKKKSLREKNESKAANGLDKLIKRESKQPVTVAEAPSPIYIVDSIEEVPPAEPLCQKEDLRESFEDGETTTTESVNNNNKDVPPDDSSFHNTKENNKSPETYKVATSESVANDEVYEFREELFEEVEIKLKHNVRTNSIKSASEDMPSDIKTINSMPLHYEDLERLEREPTPELILSDSDEDAIDQLMFNIMDIKVGPNVFDKDFFDMPSSNNEEYEEYSDEFNESTEFSDKKDGISTKDKKFIKRTPQCKICSQVFNSYMQLKKHKAVHNGDKPYLCLKCNENHTTFDQLIAHLRTHQGKLPYVCKKCNKGFRSTKALENHQPVHVLRKAVPQKKAFKCETCAKEFRKLCDLERHTRVHTGEKPSVCNICNRRFQQAHNLNKHLLIHTKEKPFECDICYKKFGRNDVLNRHLLTHSVEKPNHCKICMKSFIRASQLIAHKEKYHSKQAS